MSYDFVAYWAAIYVSWANPPMGTQSPLIHPKLAVHSDQDREIYDFATELFKRQSAWSSSDGSTRE